MAAISYQYKQLIVMLQSLHCIMLLCYESRLKIGAGKNERILNLTEAASKKYFLGALPGLHAFSGCDSTTAFHGMGKIRGLNIVKKVTKSTASLQESLQIEDTLFYMIETAFKIGLGTR